jgi:outer membrane protein TolC
MLLARREIALAELAIVARTRLAVLGLAAAQAELELVEKQAALAREFALAQTTQARAGQLSALDSAQAELMAREAGLAVALPRAALAAAAVELSTVLGRDADTSLTVVVDLALPPDEAAVPPPGLCADVSLAEAQLSAADAEIALARSQGREDYRLGVFVEGEQDRSDLGGREQEAMLGVRFSMPLPVRSVSAPVVAEKQAARRRVALEREARVREARNEVAASATEVLARHGVARAIAAELLPAARAHLAATEAAHARGEIDWIPVFRARERLAEIERSDLAARHAYHRAAVRRLSAACCIPL